MANTLKFGNGEWYGKKDTILAYNDENYNYKPLPFSFERASSATVVNKAGLIETVGSGEPRIDFLDNTKGALKLEPQRTNLVTYSEDFSNAYWTKSGASVTSDVAISPDGSLNADKLNILNTISEAKYLNSSVVTVGGGTATVVTTQMFVKKGEVTIVGLSDGHYNYGWVVADLTNGSVISVGGAGYISNSITLLANDWYLISLTFTTHSTGTYKATCSLLDGSYVSGNPKAYTSIGVIGFGVYIYGFQTEEASYATSYIPTSGQSGGVTRVADVCSQTVPDGVIGQTEGTMFIDFKPQTLDATSRYLSVENSSSVSNGWMGVFASLVSGDIRFRFYGGGWDINSSLIIEKGTRYKIAFSYKDGVQTSIYANGNLINNITASLSGKSYQKIRLSEAVFGVRGDADFNDIKLYDTIKTNAELIALTTI